MEELIRLDLVFKVSIPSATGSAWAELVRSLSPSAWVDQQDEQHEIGTGKYWQWLILALVNIGAGGWPFQEQLLIYLAQLVMHFSLAAPRSAAPTAVWGQQHLSWAVHFVGYLYEAALREWRWRISLLLGRELISKWCCSSSAIQKQDITSQTLKTSRIGKSISLLYAGSGKTRDSSGSFLRVRHCLTHDGLGRLVLQR